MSIQRENLTDLKIKNLRAETKAAAATGGKKAAAIPLAAGERLEVWDADVRQMYLRVSHTGVKTFFLFGRVKGSTKQNRYSLGQYVDAAVATTAAPFDPMAETPFLTLAQAREKARAYLMLMKSGTDPKAALADADERATQEAERAKQEAQRQREDATAKLENAFAKVRERFLTAKKPLDAKGSTADKGKSKGGKRLKPNTYKEYCRVLRSEDFAAWDPKPVNEITRKDVRTAIQAIEDRISHITANKAFAFIRAFFNWAADLDLVEIAPTANMKPPEKAEARNRVLSDAELRVVWQSLAAADAFEAPYKLLALTGQRLKEITELRTSEIYDLDGDAPYIELPGDRAKNGLPHIIPLAPLAADVLRNALAKRVAPAACPYVFTTTGKTPISGYSKAKGYIDEAVAERVAKLINATVEAGDNAEAERLGKMFGAEWVLHDLRRTFVTGLNSKGVAPHVVEAIVNHISGAAKAGVAGVYNKALYLPERRAALNMWADHIAALLNPNRSGAKVIHMRATVGA